MYLMIIIWQLVTVGPCNLKHLCKEKHFEVAAIVFPQLRLGVITVYRTPDADIDFFIERLEDCIKFVNRINKYKHIKLVISGDLNIDPRRNDNRTRLFLDMLRSWDCYCLNNLPTRKDSCLDNFISNYHSKDVRCSTTQPHLSDHLGLSLTVNISYKPNNEYHSRPMQCRPENETMTFRLINDSTINNLKVRLNNIEWMNLLTTCKSVDEAFLLFINTIQYEFDVSCPKRKKKLNSSNKKGKLNGNYKNWFTPILNNIRSLMVVSFEKSKKDDRFRIHYNNLKKWYRVQVRLAKKQANENYIIKAKNKCKAAWNVINSETGRLSAQENQKTINDTISVNEFNYFFVNIGSTVNKQSYDIIADPMDILDSANLSGPLTKPELKWRTVNTDDVNNIIAKLSNSRAEDAYGLSNFVVNKIKASLIYPLTYLINWMFKDCIYPACLKLSVTVPIYKKGNPADKNNYRPISLVPVFSKIIENIIKNQLETYFLANNMLTDFQFGFRKGLSTINAVVEVVSHIIEGFEAKEETSAVMLDLSKAFDMVPHTLLIDKLKFYCSQGNDVKLLESYLVDRYQYVKIRGKCSNLLKVVTGVPQGSVLGPFMFLIYVNDLPSFVPNKCILYADDTTLLTSNKNTDVNVAIKNYMIERSLLWFAANSLVVNENKTEEITFSLNKPNVENKNVKLLGINFDSTLSWETHARNVCIRLSRVIYLLNKLKLCTGPTLIVTAYFAFFHVHLLYGLLLWGNSPGAKNVFLWQKKAIRCIKGIGKRVSCRNYFVELGILTLPSLYILECLIYVKQHFNELELQDHHDYDTRFRDLIDIKFARLSKTQKSFNYLGAKFFNKLPLNARTVTLRRFKEVLKKWFITKCFYSVDEYEICDMNDLRF